MDNKNIIVLSKKYIWLKEKDLKKQDLVLLQKIISYHSDLYYNQQNPIISDYEYDILFKKLKFLEEKYNIKDAFTQKVWSEIKESTFKKVPHTRPMISLDNTYNRDDLIDFDKSIKRILGLNFKVDINYCIEYKFDWLWIELIYEKWNFKQAITRWNWLEWEDVTENVRTIKNIPKTINYFDYLEVRWEVIMPISSFEKLNKEALNKKEKIFSNPRNAASWSLRLLDPSITEKRNLKFFAYDLWNFEEFRLKEQKNTYFEVIKDLKNFWFEVSSYFMTFKNIDLLIKEIEKFKKPKLDFEIDWLVIKVNDINLWQEIGFTAHHPRYAIAYKFPTNILTTRILSVEHQVWKTWTITPVANLESINIWWVNIKRATLHNYDEIKKLDVKIWDYVFVKRAWEVIPKIVWVVKEERNWNEIEISIPKFCPSCNTLLKKDDYKVRLYCPNSDDCPRQIKQKLISSVWKNRLNINWLWKEQIELFWEKWFIKDLYDIFLLEHKKDKLLLLPWYKEKSVRNLFESIKKSKNQNIVNFLVALNINWVWEQASKELAKYITSNEKLLNFDMKQEELKNLKYIWEELSKNICDFFWDPKNQQLIKKLLSVITLNFKKETIWWKYVWKKICITWSFDWYNRNDLINILEKEWWIFVSNVSKNTDFLLVWKNPWSKLEKASKLWINILTLKDFIGSIK